MPPVEWCTIEHMYSLQSTNDNNKTECLGCRVQQVHLTLRFTTKIRSIAVLRWVRLVSTSLSLQQQHQTKGLMVICYFECTNNEHALCSPRSCLCTVGQILSVAKPTYNFVVFCYLTAHSCNTLNCIEHLFWLQSFVKQSAEVKVAIKCAIFHTFCTRALQKITSWCDLEMF